MADPRKTFLGLAGKDSADVVACLRPSAGLVVRPPGMKCLDLIQELRRATFAMCDMVQAISGSRNELHGHLKDVNTRTRGCFERVSTQVTSARPY